jgi:hypothetical protein
MLVRGAGKPPPWPAPRLVRPGRRRPGSSFWLAGWLAGWLLLKAGALNV